MVGDNLLAAAGASIASVALMLMATRVLFGRHPRRAMALTISWLRLPLHRVASLLIALSLGSALCFAKIADKATTPEIASELATTDTLALDSTTSSCAGDPASFADERQQAYDRFREYANGLRARINAGAASSVSQPIGATPDLPDVDTMITRLAKKLETDSGNVEGWRMLGWSYLRTGKYSEAVTAYTTALALDPKNSDTVKELEEARESAKGGGADKGIGAQVSSVSSSDAADANEMGKVMTERLSSRLETAPRDADGWLRLMRARTVLGQQDLAKAALQKALAVFENDKAVREQIVAAAKEIGLNED